MSDQLPPPRTPETVYLAAILTELLSIRLVLEAQSPAEQPRPIPTRRRPKAKPAEVVK